MKKVRIFSGLLTIGLVPSQLLPGGFILFVKALLQRRRIVYGVVDAGRT